MAALTGVIALGLPVSFASAKPAVRNGPVAYDNDADHVSLVLPNGSTRDLGLGYQPAFSPDGRHLAFIGQRGPKCTDGLYVMGVDGSDRHLVTELGQQDGLGKPTWSPDGKFIALMRYTRAGYRNVFWIVDVSTGRARVLLDLHSVNLASDPDTLSWSPDGRWIAFSDDSKTGTQVFLVRPDGSGLHAVTRVGGSFTHPDWSPDGTKLLAVQWGNRRSRVVTINPDTGVARPLLGWSSKADYEWPVWSPDGKEFVVQQYDQLEWDAIVLRVYTTAGDRIKDVVAPDDDAVTFDRHDWGPATAHG